LHADRPLILNILVYNFAMLRYFKISFYVNSHGNKLFGKQKRVNQFVTICVVVWRDDGCKTAVKGNNGGEWSSDDMVF
jgi:hypothetical protein